MAARSSLDTIITRVRRLVNDLGTPVFTDDEYQTVLDTHRIDVRYYELASPPTLSGPPSQGTVTWLDFYAPDYGGWWEEDEVILSNIWAPITPTTSDRIVGHWTFATNQQPPVYIVGKVHDPYAAAADTLDQWIALYKLEYDTKQDRLNTFTRSQRITQMTELAETYRAKQMPRTADLVRPDTTHGYELNWSQRPWSLGR